MYTRIPFVDAIAPARVRYESLIDEAARWCTERGRAADPDLFALICASACPFGEEDKYGAEHALLWTRIGVRALLRCDIPNWCTLNDSTTWPIEVVPALWQWLDFLHETRRMNPASDPLWELRKPLICYGGLDYEGRFRPEDDPSPIPCECYLPYRETVEYLDGQLKSGALIEDVLFWDPPDSAIDSFGLSSPRQRWTSDAPPPRASVPGRSLRGARKPRGPKSERR
jgi:hypothetical protein